MADWKTTLAELRYAEQEAAAAYEVAVGLWPPDSDVASQLRRLRAAHTRRAARIDGVFFGHGNGPAELPEDVRFELQRQVWRAEQARGRPDELATLLDAERSHLERYDRACCEPMQPDAADAVRDGLAEERAGVAILERLQAAVPQASRR